MGFTFSGISSQSMNIKARLTSWQASPGLRNSFVTVPGKPGVADFGSDVAERVVIIRCNVFPQFQFLNLVDVFDNLAAWLNPDNGLKQLVLDDVPDRYFTGNAYRSVARRLPRTTSRRI
jgi:phage-related protein